MIIYGTSGAKNLRVHQHAGERCPHCEETGTLETGTFSKYAHVYWIPLFSIGKRSITQCTNCGVEIAKKNYSFDLENKIDEAKKENKIPFWHFSGLILIAGLVLFGMFQSNQNDNENAVFITDPQVGDVYEFGQNSSYSLMKVENVRGDSVEIVFNEYETNRKSSLDEVRGKPFSDSTYIITKQGLQEMFDEETIFDIHRN